MNRLDHCVVRTDGREVSAQFLSADPGGVFVMTCAGGWTLRVPADRVRPETEAETARRTQAGYYVEERG